jgi:ATP synthase protein I
VKPQSQKPTAAFIGASWLALLVGMVVTMKTYWVALKVQPGVRKTD